MYVQCKVLELEAAANGNIYLVEYIPGSFRGDRWKQLTEVVHRWEFVDATWTLGKVVGCGLEFLFGGGHGRVAWWCKGQKNDPMMLCFVWWGHT